MADDEVTEETSATETEPTTEDEPLGPSGVKALAAMKEQLKAARTEAKIGREAAKRLADLEDRDKSELEKAQKRADAAEKAAADHELASTRLAVAFEKGLTPAQAKRLVGTSRDELEADADEVLRDFPVAKFAGTADQGSRTSVPAPTLAERIAEAQEKQDWSTVGALKAQQLRDLSAAT